MRIVPVNHLASIGGLVSGKIRVEVRVGTEIRRRNSRDKQSGENQADHARGFRGGADTKQHGGLSSEGDGGSLQSMPA